MKAIRNCLLLFSLAAFITLAGCKKDNSSTSGTQDSSVQSEALLKNFQLATYNDQHLVNYHQNTGSPTHDSCYYYWDQFSRCDSAYSFHFYEYCRTIYANNGGHNYGHEGWHWDHENGEMHHGEWQCGLDTLQFQNWNGHGDFMKHDSLMHSQMESHGMEGDFSGQVNQLYSNMQALRASHYHNHNYHW
jgi:hypothetical protein